MHTSTKNQAKGDVVLTDTTLAKIDNSASVFTQKMKRWIQLLSGGLVFGLSLSMLGVTPAMAGSFTFTKIADNQGEFTSISNVAMNDSGTVAFAATLKDSSNTIYTSDGVSNTEIIKIKLTSADPYSTPGYIRFLDISNKGTIIIGTTPPQSPTGPGTYRISNQISVVRDGSLTDLASSSNNGYGGTMIQSFALNKQGDVVVLTSYSYQGPLTTYNLFLTGANQPARAIAQVFPPAADVPFNSINFFDINNQGEVIFAATTKQSPSTTTIFSSNGGEPTRIVETDASALRVNDKGNILLLSKDSVGLFDRSNGTLRPIADTSSGTFQGLGFFSINNNDNVAFTATLNGGVRGIFTGADPVANKVIATGDSLEGSTVTDLSLSNLNNNDQIAFQVVLANGERAIYCADPVADKVIATGDSLEGSTITDFSFSGLNNNGQIAFSVKLANGEQAIYRADPVAETDVSQPEPQVEDGSEVNTPL